MEKSLIVINFTMYPGPPSNGRKKRFSDRFYTFPCRTRVIDPLEPSSVRRSHFTCFQHPSGTMYR